LHPQVEIGIKRLLSYVVKEIDVGRERLHWITHADDYCRVREVLPEQVRVLSKIQGTTHISLAISVLLVVQRPDNTLFDVLYVVVLVLELQRLNEFF
jgi:hypothetical protein